MKNDMRFTIPLWQIGAIVLLIILTILVGAVRTISEVTADGFQFIFELESVYSFILLATSIVLIIYFVLFMLRIQLHNKKYPRQKINPFSFRPQEYIQDDEFFEEVTKRATQKVYSYYTWILPFFLGASLGSGAGRTFILVGLLMIAIGQYWIYYSTMRKMVRGSVEE